MRAMLVVNQPIIRAVPPKPWLNRITGRRRVSTKGASGAASPTRNSGRSGGPRSSDCSSTLSGAGYQTVTRTWSRCSASRRAAVGLWVTKWRSPTVSARATDASASTAAAVAMIPTRSIATSGESRGEPRLVGRPWLLKSRSGRPGGGEAAQERAGGGMSLALRGREADEEVALRADAAGRQALADQAHEAALAGLPGEPDDAPADRRLQRDAAAFGQRALGHAHGDPEVVAAHQHVGRAAQHDGERRAAGADHIAVAQARGQLHADAPAAGQGVLDPAAAQRDQRVEGQDRGLRRSGRRGLDDPLGDAQRLQALVGGHDLAEPLLVAAGTVGMG